MADLVTIFKSQEFYRDMLKIEITAKDFNRRTCDIVYLLINSKTAEEIARVKPLLFFKIMR